MYSKITFISQGRWLLLLACLTETKLFGDVQSNQLPKWTLDQTVIALPRFQPSLR